MMMARATGEKMTSGTEQRGLVAVVLGFVRSFTLRAMMGFVCELVGGSKQLGGKSSSHSVIASQDA